MKTLIPFFIGFILANTLNPEFHKEVKNIELKTSNTLERIRKDVSSIAIEVTATMYYAVESQCDSDPLITAGMYEINPSKASEQKWIAVSRNLLKRWGGKFDYGDKVRISGTDHKDGVYTIVDTMNKRYRNRIDFLETEGTPMYRFENVKMVKI